MKYVYFIGIGGIGMSALARWFLHEGWRVAGYDLTGTALTRALESEGALVHHDDDPALIPPEFRDPATTLVVFTPAVPPDHRELSWFLERGFVVEKRSEMLGHITEGKFTMAVAGTHGKTTTTTLVAWLNRALTGGGSAFLGGISKNFGSNLVLEPADDPNCIAQDLSGPHPPLGGPLTASTKPKKRLAVEADEFDRSFLRLNPDVALITSVDADHLDIYGTHDAVREAFSQFVDRIKPGGALVVNEKVELPITRTDIDITTYSWENIELGIPGRINQENAAGAVAMIRAAAKLRGERVDEEKLRQALVEFRGVRRRFDIWVNTEKGVYMDDYAHHPNELAAALESLRGMFPGRRVTAVFQPHLYTRTRDLAPEFGRALSEANELILTPIYPAREKPIEGVTSELIGRSVSIPWRVVEKENLARVLQGTPTDVVVTFGAGNIENHCAEIAQVIESKSVE